MSKFQQIIHTRYGHLSLKVCLVFLLGWTSLPAFSQCPMPTDCAPTYSKTIDLDALPTCGGGTISVRGDIDNERNQTTCLNGTLRCFEFIFHRSNSATAESLSFPIGQGAGCNGETDAIYTSINGICSRVWDGGSNANVTLTFPVGVNDIKLYGCLNSASFIQICDLCRTPSCTPSVTCPNLSPSAVACASEIPAPATNAVSFVALGGTITDCGQTVEVTSNDVYSSNLTCQRRTLTRAYTVKIGDYVQTCEIRYPILAAVTTFSNCPAALTVSCTADVPAARSSVTATNNCGETLEVTSNDVRTNQTCANRYTITRTYTATDACNNSNKITCVQTITVNDETAPTIKCPETITVSCASEVPVADPTSVVSSDGCGGKVVVIHVSDDRLPSSCANRFSIARTYRATDECGNSSECVQTIHVNDVTKPTLEGTPTLPNIACSAPLPTASESVYTATDLCAGDVTVSASNWVLESTNKTCVKSYKRIWTATDACGNSATATQTIQKDPPTLPTMTAPANILGVCGSLPAPTQLSFTNGSTGDCALTGLSELSTFSTVPACAGTVIETWTALDACGRYLAPVSRTIQCTTELSCSTNKEKDSNCDGFNGSATVTLKGGVAGAYKWDNGETTQTATQLNQGLHHVTVTTTSGCITICNVTIGNTTDLACSVVQNKDASCKGSGSATVTATGGASNIRFVWDNGETTATATHLSVGTHMVKVISGNCTTMCSIVIEGKGGFTCSATPQKAAGCSDKDGSATVTVENKGTYTYLWDNGETTATATHLSAGVHHVTVKNADGCESTCTVHIERAATNLYCSTTQTATTATVQIIGGTGAVTILWDNGETTATAVHLTSGVHKVVLTDAAGCTTGCSVTMGSVDAFYCKVRAVKHLKCSKDTDGSAEVTVKGGAAPYKILWDNGETTTIATHLSIGDHAVTVTDSKGETTTCSVLINCKPDGCEENEDHFYPTGTTCCTYTNGSSQALKYLGYKSKEHITKVNPNAFFYYAKIVAPSKSFTVNIVQTKNVESFKFLSLNNEQIQLWDANCSKSVKGFATGNGQGKVSIKNAKVGATYILAVRLDTRPLLSTDCKKETPKVTYTVASYINHELVAGSKGSIQLKPNYEQPDLNAGKCSKYAPESDMSSESLLNNTLLVQPNPAQSVVNVVFESVAAESSMISVTNINGAIVQTMSYEAKEGENQVQLEVQNLPIGTYIVTVQTAHQWMTKQLVILK